MLKTVNIYTVCQNNFWIQFIDSYGETNLTNQDKMSKICHFLILLESKGVKQRSTYNTLICMQKKLSQSNFRSVSPHNWLCVFVKKKKKKRKLEGGRVGCHCEGNIHKQGFVKYGWKKIITHNFRSPVILFEVKPINCEIKLQQNNYSFIVVRVCENKVAEIYFKEIMVEVKIKKK